MGDGVREPRESGGSEGEVEEARPRLEGRKARRRSRTDAAEAGRRGVSVQQTGPLLRRNIAGLRESDKCELTTPIIVVWNRNGTNIVHFVQLLVDKRDVMCD